MKCCNKCNVKKLLSEFHKDKKSKDGHVNSCKVCVSKKLKSYYINNISEISRKTREYRQNSKEKIKKINKKYYLENKEEILKKNKIYRINNKLTLSLKGKERKRLYYLKNKDRIRARIKKWRKNNYEKDRCQRNSYIKLRRKTDYNFLLKTRIRNRFNQAMRTFSKTGKIASIKNYKINIEAILNHLGSKPGKNYVIDHIVPLFYFNFNNHTHIQAAFLDKNHQWLTNKQNSIKGKTFIKTGKSIQVLNFINKFLIENGEDPLEIK